MPAPRFYAVVKPDGSSLFGKTTNGHRYSQVFNDQADALSALDKYRKQRPTDKQHLQVVEVSWNG